MQFLKKISTIFLLFLFCFSVVFNIPIKVQANETEFENISVGYYLKTTLDLNDYWEYAYNYEVERDSYIVVRFVEQHETLSDGRIKIKIFGLMFSDKPFKTKRSSTQTHYEDGVTASFNESSQPDFVSASKKTYNDYYYAILDGLTTALPEGASYFLYAPNSSIFPYDMTSDEIADYIAKDLTINKDEFEEEIIDENSAVYNKALDFLTISGDYKVKYTVQKNSDNKWEFITPNEAGLELKWDNRQNIDNSYVNITIYGEFYESFWKSSSISAKVSYKKVDRDKEEKFIYQKDLIEEARKNLGKEKAHGFVVKYIYIQSFGVIDGIQCRGRIYKLDSNLVLAGNGSSDDLDAYTPEFTNGSSMPDDYTPDDNDVDPEKTEPSPDKKDDTIINLPDVIPIPDDDYGEFSLNTVLDAWESFWLFLRNLTSTLGQFPQLLASVFSFLPSQIVVSIGLSLLAVVVLRFLGR